MQHVDERLIDYKQNNKETSKLKPYLPFHCKNYEYEYKQSKEDEALSGPHRFLFWIFKVFRAGKQIVCPKSVVVGCVVVARLTTLCPSQE